MLHINSPKHHYQTKQSHNLTVVRKLSAGGSAGNLPKWILNDGNGLLYAKGRSKTSSFEPEAEVCAYRLARLFGVPAIEYKLITIPQLSGEPVCISRDYSRNRNIMSLYNYVSKTTGKNPAELSGKEKFKLVESVLPDNAKHLHRAILLFDYIVGNTDRHLRNFDIVIELNGKALELVPMFDTGACLFSSSTEIEIKRACAAGNNFIHSKPYFDPHFKQVEFLLSIGCNDLLKHAKKIDVYTTINSCFKGSRAKYLGRFVMQNAERLGLLCS